MYIIKNALRSLSRAKGRNILIGIIALVIAVSSCLGLSIRQAAESAKQTALDGLSVTATISFDRAGTIGDIAKQGEPGSGNFDFSAFSEQMGETSALTLSEYLTYAACESVDNYYYTLTAYVNGTDGFSPVSDSESTGESSSTGGTFSGGGDSGGGNYGGVGGFGGGGMFGDVTTGDFTVVGYSSDLAMTDIISGNTQIQDGGAVFEEGTENYDCIISSELATTNGLAVGDTVLVCNPSAESETYTLTVVGIYASQSANDFSRSVFGTSQDPANEIYVSAAALQKMLDASAAVSTSTTDSSTGRTVESKMVGTLNFTYTFEDVKGYEAFEEEARTAGLSDSYVITSSDLSAYEESLSPLETLSNLAKWFLIIILAIGGVILVVLNIFNVRERKYEVGVLTAMGMKKWKVAAQFTCEILVITMIAVILGAGIGAVSSVPVTNALLQTQLTSADNKQAQIDESFGRGGNMGGGKMPGGAGGFSGGDFDTSNIPDNLPSDVSGGGFNMFDNMKDTMNDVKSKTVDYVTEVDSAMNLTVALEMILVGFFLTLVSSAASVLFIMRYDPLKILANRD